MKEKNDKTCLTDIVVLCPKGIHRYSLEKLDNVDGLATTDDGKYKVYLNPSEAA